MENSNENSNGDWKIWSKFVLAELKRLSMGLEKMGTKMDIISNDITMLKVKATIWGAIGASIPVLLSFSIQFLLAMAKNSIKP